MIRKRVKSLGKELLKKLDEAAQLAKAAAEATAGPKSSLVHQKAENKALVNEEELPVVARLMVEIRSDGTRTVARGAMEDVMSGEKAQVRAEGGSPMQLAGSLAKSMLSVPALALQAARTVVEAKKNLKGKSDK
ncbi:MAG TPA: hypothetical protein VHO25_02040 [Polyangiaceae bacterium]|nr:hypothetical protein [Polyangiaceae bacterium]